MRTLEQILASLPEDERAEIEARSLRLIIREEVRAAFMDHEADLAVARVRRSAALEDLARNDGEQLFSGLYEGGSGEVRLTGTTIGGGWIA